MRFWVPRDVKQRGRELTCFCLMRRLVSYFLLDYTLSFSHSSIYTYKGGSCFHSSKSTLLQVSVNVRRLNTHHKPSICFHLSHVFLEELDVKRGWAHGHGHATSWWKGMCLLDKLLQSFYHTLLLFSFTSFPRFFHSRNTFNHLYVRSELNQPLWYLRRQVCFDAN